MVDRGTLLINCYAWSTASASTPHSRTAARLLGPDVSESADDMSVGKLHRVGHLLSVLGEPPRRCGSCAGRSLRRDLHLL